MSQLNITKINGVKNLITYFNNNPHLIDQTNDLLAYFPVFNTKFGHQPIVDQIFGGDWEKWDTSLHSVIMTNHRELVGFGQTLIKNNYAENFNIIIKKNYRHQGLGHILLTQLETIGISNQKTIFVIWCENHIKPFYLLNRYVDADKMRTTWDYKLYKMVKYLKN